MPCETPDAVRQSLHSFSAVMMPAESMSAEPMSTKSVPNVASSKILIIDDEQLVIDVTKAHLNDAGFWNVVGVNDSVDAVHRMKRENPDLMLMDISMPDVSGNYLIRIARNEANLSNVPVMVVTADDSDETRQKALELGANDVLTKPLSPGDLVQRVEQALTQKFDKDEVKHRERQARSKPVMEKYNRLRNLAGRSDEATSAMS